MTSGASRRSSRFWTRREALRSAAAAFGSLALALALPIPALAFSPSLLLSVPPSRRPAVPPSLAEGAPGPLKVPLARIVHEARGDFAPGRREGVELPRQGGAAGLAAGAQGGTYVSAPLETSFAASHAALSWEAIGDGEARLWLRGSGDGERWGAWLPAVPEPGRGETASSNPLRVGEARWLQYRVELPPEAELRRVTLSYLQAGVRAPGGVSLQVRPGQLGGQSKLLEQVVSREGWRADEALRFKADGSEAWPRAYVPVKKIVVHHTAGANVYSDGAAEVRAIYAFHAIERAFGDIGYHLLIDNLGRVFEGRYGRDQDPDGGPGREVVSRDVVGGHATGWNYGTTSVALLGNFDEAPLPSVMREKLVEVLVFLSERYGVDPLGADSFLLTTDVWRDDALDLPGHRDCTPTACPGHSVYAELPGIRREVARALALRDRPKPAVVQLAAGRDQWPGRLAATWSGPPSAQFSFAVEGWWREPGADPITELAGFDEDSRLVWSAWGSARSVALDVGPTEHGHYAVHVRTRTAPGVESPIVGRVTALVEPQAAADDVDRRRASARGRWGTATAPKEYYGRGYRFAAARPATRVPRPSRTSFRWQLVAPRAGTYQVQVHWPTGDNRSAAAAYELLVNDRAAATWSADQRQGGGRWQTLGSLALPAGARCILTLSDAEDGTVAADAARLVWSGP